MIITQIPWDTSKPKYVGPTDVTPGSTDVILETSGKELTSNITLRKVPSNYGLVEWKSSEMTLSIT